MWPSKLSDYAFINPSVSITHLSDSELVSFIPMGDVSESGVWKIKSAAPLKDVKSGFTRFQELDAIVAKITPCFENGKGALVKGTVNKIVFGSTEFHVVRAKEGIDPRFVFYVTQDQSFRIQGEAHMVGSAGQRRVTKSFIEGYQLPIFSDDETKKISDVLDKVSNSIEKTQALIAKYANIKQGMMQDLFTRGVDENGQLRLSYEEAPHLYQETNIGFFPKEWDVGFLQKHLNKSLYGPRFDAGDYDSEGNVKTIRGTDFTKDGEILYEQVPRAKLSHSKIKRHILKDGDVVVVTTADCGLTAVFTGQKFNYIPSAYAVKYQFKDRIEPYFFRYWMMTHEAKIQVNKYIRQGTLGNLPGSDLNRFIFPAPPLPEQKRIIANLRSIEAKIFRERSLLSKFGEIKLGLLQDLLTGKVRVNEDIEERKEAVA